ncbi:PAS domain S-box-containing protein [Roseateles sp. YR242]|uniref:PAS domain-containing hybrid sensor histidine kinase/response regulator n=1 Tax=Roseateles sp. YR242 TaxID=1855305 RepID=UPI0008AD32F9|nr:PAS domain-containing protein [Roseateles sp. YR242]SEL06788.1 PAS domain S-box-containing protein [Roseateles sp. YR242]
MAGTTDTPAFLTGEGEMARLIRARDWSRTALGAPATWPSGLRAMVRLLLTTCHPALIFWGPEQLCLYNDGYRRSLGHDKHPSMLGLPGREAFPESWQVAEPQIRSIMNGGPSTWRLNHLIPLLRDGVLEDVYWTYSFSPIDDETAPHGIGGVLVLCTDTTSHIQRAHELAKEHLQFATLFQQAPAFMALLTGPEHVFTMVNPAYLQVVGQRVLLGKPVLDALPEALAQGYVDILNRVYSTGQPFEGVGVNYRVEPPGEAARWITVDFVCQPVRDDEGDVTGVFVLGSDVTARARAQEQLAASEEQLRMATEGGGVGLWDVNMMADTLYWTPRTREMFGIHGARSVSLRDFYEGLHPADFQAVSQAFAAVTVPNGSKLYNVEYRTVGKDDGQVRWIAARGVPVFDAHGQVQRVVGSVMDITQRKHDEQRIHDLNDALEQKLSLYLAERKLFGDLVEGTDAMVQVSDHNFNWMAINAAAATEFERIYGIRPHVGDNMLVVLKDFPEHQSAVKAIWRRALDGEEFTEVGEFGAEGNSRHYEMHFRTLHRDGRRIGAYQFVYDVTERIEKEERLARTEAALAQAQKMEAIGQLVGGIAHDFNNLLQAIRGNFDIISKRPADESLVLRCAEKGQSISERAAKLTSQLLAFSREHTFDLKPVCLQRLLNDLEPLFRTTLGSRIGYRREAPEADICVMADAVQLEMALLNLVINSRDATAEGGHVVLQLSGVGETVLIAVNDDGTGMSAEVLERCFDPFFTTKSVGKGSGLGLSQVYGMCKRVGGAVEVDSTEGVGTTVTLRLRRADPGAEVLQAPNGSGAQDARKHHVLVVDDDADVRDFLTDAVSSLGHDVVTASDGREALRILGTERVDLLLADFSMPHMDGAELARHAMALRPDLRVVFASGHPDADAFHAAIGREAVVLRKPFDIETLRRTLNSQLEKPGGH